MGYYRPAHLSAGQRFGPRFVRIWATTEYITNHEGGKSIPQCTDVTEGVDATVVPVCEEVCEL
jgi:hypothetical protein